MAQLEEELESVTFAAEIENPPRSFSRLKCFRLFQMKSGNMQQWQSLGFIRNCKQFEKPSQLASKLQLVEWDAKLILRK